MRLDELIARVSHGAPATVGLRLVAGNGSVNVADITEDSRTAMPGSLFVARPGLRSDGRVYVSAAVEAGARVVLADDPAIGSSLPRGVALIVSDDVPLAAAHLAEAFFGFPSRGLALVGVTGTNGKTTVATICHRFLNTLGVRTGLIGTVEIDDGREVAAAEMTTPPAIELSRTLATMVESGCAAAVMEVSSHALDQRRPAGLSFDAAVFTNLSGDHLDYHLTMEGYAAAKRRLFELLVSDGDASRTLSVVNGGDPYSDVMLGPVRVADGARVCRVGGSAGDLSVHTESADLDGLTLAISGAVDGTRVDVRGRLPLIGGYNAMNAAQAVAAAVGVVRAVGGDDGAAGDLSVRLSRALGRVRTPRGRLDRVHTAGDDVAVLVDFAHTDHAIESMLRGVRPLVRAPGRLWVVFGAGGNKDRGKRPRMGRAAAELADRVVLTSDNPRSESPGSIITQVLSGVPEGRRDRVSVQADRRRAIAFAVERAGPGDVVVIAGKGHEGYQEVRSEISERVERVVFDDFAEAQAALAARQRARGAGV